MSWKWQSTILRQLVEHVEDYGSHDSGQNSCQHDGTPYSLLVLLQRRLDGPDDCPVAPVKIVELSLSRVGAGDDGVDAGHCLREWNEILSLSSEW